MSEPSAQPSLTTRDTTVEEALRLLPRVPHGRAAVTRYALPYILMARHSIRDGELLLKVVTSRVDARLIDGTVLAYEADNHGCCQRDSSATWAAQLVGTATVIEPDAADHAALWPGQDRPEDASEEELYVRLTPKFATVRHRGFTGLAPGTG